MKNQIQKYIDIANYTDHMEISEKIIRMQEMLENGKYLLAFMGTFSAGKSRLINNLLGKDILPVHVRETTALITYIQYAETDFAELVGADGSIEECTFEDIADLWQSGDSADKINGLDCVRLYINSNLLRNGMIIADTPGINTVLQPHVEKTVNLLESANRVVYVMGGSMSGVDRDFVECIHNSGIETVMVRSKMDELSSTDENIDNTIKKEKSELAKYTSDPVFFLSNEKDSKYYDTVSELETFLMNNVASGLKSNLEKAVASRLSLYTNTLEKLLKEKERSINMLLNNNSSLYSEEKRKTERKLEKLNNSLADNQKKLKNNFESAKSNAMREAMKSKDKKAESAEKWIASQDYSDNIFSISSFCDDLEKRLKRDCCDIRNKYISSFDKFLGDNINELQNQLAADEIYFDTTPPATLDESEAIMEEYQERVAALNVLKESLEAKISECQSQINDKEDQLSEANQQIKVCEAAMSDVQNQLTSLGNYIPRYIIQEGSHTNEKKMTAIGKAADIASILIPGETWAKGVKWLFKGAKSVEAIKGVDLVMDGVRMVHNFRQSNIGGSDIPEIGMNDEYIETEYTGEEGRRSLENQLQSKETSANLLDFLSIEYYFKKIGKKMDKPDMVVEDKAYKERYENERANIIAEFTAKANDAAEERIRLLRIKDEAEKAKIRQEALERELKNAELKFAELEKKHDKECKNALNSNYIRYYTSFVDSSLSDFVESLRTDVLPSIETKMTAYINTYGISMTEELSRQNEALNELESRFNGEGKAALEEELSKCREYITSLENEEKNLCTV